MIRPGDVIEIDGTRYRAACADHIATSANVQSTRRTVSTSRTTARDADRRPADQRHGPDAQTSTSTTKGFGCEIFRLGSGGESRRTGPAPRPYKILRQPMPTSDEPFQMPEGTAIDLRASGQAIEIETARDGFFYVPDAHVGASTTGPDRDHVHTGRPRRAVSVQQNVGLHDSTVRTFDARRYRNIFLLVGRRENAPPPASGNGSDARHGSYRGETDEQMQELKEPFNWLRGESRWIVIGSQSGRVVTIENAFVNPPDHEHRGPKQIDGKPARQIRKAREFAREMVQVGGR